MMIFLEYLTLAEQLKGKPSEYLFIEALSLRKEDHSFAALRGRASHEAE